MLAIISPMSPMAEFVVWRTLETPEGELGPFQERVRVPDQPLENPKDQGENEDPPFTYQETITAVKNLLSREGG